MRKNVTNMAETKTAEQVYTIPLRKAFRKAYGKRTPYAIRLVHAFLRTHTKAEDIKLGRHINEALWARGLHHPPRRIRVTVTRDGSAVHAELIGYQYEAFTVQPKAEKKGMKEKLLERIGPKAVKKQEEEQLVEKPEEAKKEQQQKVETG